MKSQYLNTMNLVHNASTSRNDHQPYEEMKNRYLSNSDSLSEHQLRQVMKNHYLER